MTVPVPAHRSGLLALLLQTVRMEFRVEVFRPDPDDPVFTAGRCRVPACRRPLNYGRVGLCPIHQTAWTRAGSPDIEQWAPLQGPGQRNTVSFPACLVEGCNRARGHIGLCARHRGFWAKAGRPDAAAWAAGITYTPSIRGEAPCRFVGCERNADFKAGFCAGHHARWKTAGKPDDLQTYVTCATGRGEPMLDMRGLSQQIRLELGLGLQRRADAGDRRTCLRAIQQAVTWIRESQVASMLDLDDDAWRKQAKGPSGKRGTNSALTFVTDIRYHLEALLAGGAWEREYDRDTWDLRRLGRLPENTPRYLRFTSITQPWLRALAKRWARRMITTKSATGSLVAQVRYLGKFAEFAAGGPDDCTEPERLTRQLLEAWFASMDEEQVHVATRKHRISAVSVFLSTVHRLGWEERLPRTAVIVPGDGPPAPPSKPRFLSEVIMSQCEDDANLTRFPDPQDELVLRIVMACGLRSKDAIRLPFDCVVRDDARAPYLAWVNHKGQGRVAFFPIVDKLVTLIHAQQDRVRARFPAGCELLFPAGPTTPTAANRCPAAPGSSTSTPGWRPSSWSTNAATTSTSPRTSSATPWAPA
ncbi:tyrosine-type recombinase/integrase [Saccharothrix syringae]|uniref:tyrosine-type recombinase/integrase n=1 Tax=Saccharothrix syringae TaxID=103733 RepID=UPI001D17500A|nr:hypothetical protein [Saccharothrix syringae]